MGSCLAKGKGPAYQLAKHTRRYISGQKAVEKKEEEEEDCQSSPTSPASPGSDPEEDTSERVRELRIQWEKMKISVSGPVSQNELSQRQRKEQLVAHSARGRNYCSVY